MAHMPGAGRIHGGMYAVNLGNRFNPRYRFPWNFVLGDGEIRQRQMAIIDHYESFIWSANDYHSTASAALFWDHNWDSWSRIKECLYTWTYMKFLDVLCPHGAAAELPHPHGAAAELPHGAAAELPHGAAAELPHGAAAELPQGAAAELPHPHGAALELPHGAPELPHGAPAELPTADAELPHNAPAPRAAKRPLSDGGAGPSVKRKK